MGTLFFIAFVLMTAPIWVPCFVAVVACVGVMIALPIVAIVGAFRK